MSVTGIISNGVVVLPDGISFPEGTQVEVTPRELTSEQDAFLELALKLAKPRPYLPVDYSLNHGHYVSGEPKKS
jgi:hypothetical protein